MTARKTRFARRLAALLLAAALCALGLAGCGGEPGVSTQEDKTMVEIKMQNGGVMKLQLDREAAPITVDNFVSLVEDGFYDGLVFHRIVKDFMIQGGDPDGNGTGGPGHQIKGEFAENGWDKNNISHQKGVISMARSNDPDSAGSQFFIVHGDASFLDKKYAAFGQVVEGLDVLDELAALPTEWNMYGTEKSVPLEPPVIESIRVVAE